MILQLRQNMHLYFLLTNVSRYTWIDENFNTIIHPCYKIFTFFLVNILFKSMHFNDDPD